ncbi:MAG: hypothetical protein KBD53_11985, partial [Candidatus Omnitrophica bacterium]|nr:hypothetical protein [Candidatus Omnitrophota bacterium]
MMDKIYYLMAVVILFFSVSTKAEAMVTAKDSAPIKLNTEVTQANTASKVAEDNDRKDLDNDSTYKSDFNKEADGALSIHIQQM